MVDRPALASGAAAHGTQYHSSDCRSEHRLSLPRHVTPVGLFQIQPVLKPGAPMRTTGMQDDYKTSERDAPHQKRIILVALRHHAMHLLLTSSTDSMGGCHKHPVVLLQVLQVHPFNGLHSHMWLVPSRNRELNQIGCTRRPSFGTLSMAVNANGDRYYFWEQVDMQSARGAELTFGCCE